MHVIINLINSLKYPLKNPVKLLILGVMLIIPILNIIGLGYYLRIITSTYEGSSILPGFENIGELFVNGIKLLIVGLIYSLIPLTFFALASILGSSFLFISLISAIAISLFAFMGIGNMVYYNNDISAAFRYNEIISIINTIGWLKYIIWWVAIVLILIVTGTIIGIVGGILLYYVLGFLFLSFGYGYLALFQSRTIAITFASSKNY